MCAVIAAVHAAAAEAEVDDETTFFEDFSSSPAARGWLNQSTSSTQFTVNPGGWLDASIVRSSASRALFCKPLPAALDQTRQAFWSMDVMLVSTANDYQQALFGLFNRAVADNHHDVVADRFFFKLYNGTPRGNRHDIAAWDSSGTSAAAVGGPDNPGIPYAAAVRVLQRYWYEGGIGKSELAVHQIRANGSTGPLIMAAGPAAVIGAGKTLAFDAFGLGNRTDGGLLAANVIKVDNLYFSTARQNTAPVIPSFGGTWGITGDFNADGGVDINDFSILASQWLAACVAPGWCAGTDLNKSGKADFADVLDFADRWLDAEPFTGYAVASQKDIAYLGAGRPALDLYYPGNARPGDRFPGIVIIHGGGWTGGDKAASREINIANTLVPRGYVCVSINYQLGSLCWPENIKDCKSAVQFLRVNADAYRIDPDRIGVIGGSAGGHLACMVGYADAAAGLEPTTPYPGVNTRVQAVVDLYGITNLWTRQNTASDGTPTGVLKDGTAPTMLGCLRTACPALWTLASPVAHVTADDPPTLILHGTGDTTVDYLQSSELDNTLRQAGVWSDLHLLSGLGHSFDLQPSGHDLRPRVIDFFDTFLKR